MNNGVKTLSNGPAGAAFLAAGIGCFSLGLLAVAGDRSPALARMLTLYVPSGPLSGVSTVAIAVWLAAWFALAQLLRTRTISIVKTGIASFVLIALGLLLTFPPIADRLPGRR